MERWLFQSNPDLFNIVGAIRQLDHIPWVVKRGAKSMSVGDPVAIWIAAGTRVDAAPGIYALGEIAELPCAGRAPLDRAFWKKGSIHPLHAQAVVKLTIKLLDRPLLKRDLVNDQVLATLSVIRSAAGTIFKVTDTQWERLIVIATGEGSTRQHEGTTR